MAAINLSTVRLQISTSARPLASQMVTVRYRPSTLTDTPSNYTLVTNNAQVKPQNPNATSPALFDFVNSLGNPFPLDFALQNFQTNVKYIVWVTDNCNLMGAKMDFVQFECIDPVSFDINEPEGGIGIIVQGTDIYKTKFTIRKFSDNTVFFTETVPVTFSGQLKVCKVEVPAPKQAQYDSNEQYYWEYETYILINGVDVISSSTTYPGSLGVTCQQAPFSIGSQDCPAADNLAVTDGGVVTWALPTDLTNITANRVGYKLVYLNGNFIYNTGLTPANDLNTNAITTTISQSVQIANRVMAVRQAVLCGDTEVTNLAGDKYFIPFACLTVSLTPTATSGTYGLSFSLDNVDQTDLNGAAVNIKRTSNNVVAYTANLPRTVNKIGDDIPFTLVADTDYYLEYYPKALVNGVQITSTTKCGPYTFHTLAPGFSISPQPTNQSVNLGQNATFTSGGSGGTSPYTYQWQRNISGTWTNISGATASSYTLTSAQAGDNGAQFRMIGTDAASATQTSSVVTLTVIIPAFAITPQPVNQSVTAGNAASFTSGATGGTGSITYQWQVTTASNPTSNADYTDVSNGGGITGATTTTLNIGNPQVGDNNKGYRIKATQGSTVIYSTLARLYVAAAPVTYTARIGYIPGGTDPYLEPGSLDISTAIWFPYQTGLSTGDAISLANTVTNFGNIADNYLLYDMATAMTARGRVTNGNTSLIPAAEFSDNRKMVSGGRTVGASNNGWPLSLTDPITFTTT